MSKPSIAIVHDSLVVTGGAEKFTVFLSQAIPEAPIYTSAYIAHKTFPYFATKRVITLRGGDDVHSEKQYKRQFLRWFVGFRKLDLSGYDIVFSTSTYAAKFCKVKKGAIHICYLHSPFRFLWKRNSYSEGSLPFKGMFLWFVDRFIPLLQRIDRYYTNRIDRIITNSRNMANLIKDIYGRDADIIHPPIDTASYESTAVKKDYYLVVSRLLSYKRVDMAVRVCKSTNRKLVVIGDGPEMGSLKAIAGAETTFLGQVSDADLRKYYAEARGLIFPGVEDFGLVPVEAQASGCPVIAYKAGGVLETVLDGTTGILFDRQNVEDLSAALTKFESKEFSVADMLENVKRFDVGEFQNQINDLIDQYSNNW